MLRGGSWDDAADRVRSAAPRRSVDFGANAYGFRVVLENPDAAGGR